MKRLGLITCLVALIVGCNSENSNSSLKPTVSNGQATEIDEALFAQIKKAGEHKTLWSGYEFDKVAMYLIHA